MAETHSHQGFHGDDDPKRKRRARGGVLPQEQAWPGRTDEMEPRPDHGEQSYVGAGKLEGKRALITGGDSGIGRAVAIAYAREGAAVVIGYVDEKEEQDARDTVHWIERAGRRGLALREDLASPAACRRLVTRTVRELGGLDILVNNAAVHFEVDSFLDVEPAQLERVFRTNLFAPFWLAQAAVPHLVSGGVILNTGSVVAFKGHPTLPDYAATKAALHNLTLTLATALADKSIRVNCVAPGPVWTPLIASTRPAEKQEHFGADTFWQRPAQPAEIAPSFVFLASADGRYYTGEVLAPTGGPFTSR